MTKTSDLEARRQAILKRVEESRPWNHRTFEVPRILRHFHRKFYGREWDGFSLEWAVECLVAEHGKSALSLVGKTAEELAAMLRETIQQTRAVNPQTINEEKTAIVRPNAERNQWLYDQYVNCPQKTLTAIRREAKKKGWLLGSDAALRNGVMRHCRTLNIDMPKRKETRTKPD